MVRIAFSSSFRKAFERRIKTHPDLEEIFWGKITLFLDDPFTRKLRTHKLSGKLKDLWSFSIEFDVRVIFYFETKTKCVFIDIGTHDAVY